jgi:peptide/nickel transport system substrate-binding protein
MKFCSVIPKEAIDLYGNDFGRNPVGTGPFYKKLWVENEKLVLRKNEKYFEMINGESLPYLDAVAISFIPDKKSAFLEFTQGNIDFVSGLDAGYKDEILQADGQLKEKYKETVVLHSIPYLNTEYLGINMNSDHPALKNIHFRKALNLSIDKPTMVKYLRNNIGTSAEAGMVPNGLPGFNAHEDYGYSFDVDQAIQEIELSGLDLKSLPPIEIVTTSNYRDLCEYIQFAWKKIGIQVNVNVVPNAHLRELKAKGGADLFRASWIADYPDAENYLSMFYSENFTPNGPNYTFFKDSLFDVNYMEIQRATDESFRYQLSRKCDSMVVYQAAVIPLFYDQVVRFSHKNIEGLEGNAMNLLELKTVVKK